MSDRIYLVHDAHGPEVLVEASSRSQAIAVVASERYVARVAKQADMLRAMKNGARVITRMHQASQPAEENSDAQ